MSQKLQDESINSIGSEGVDTRTEQFASGSDSGSSSGSDSDTDSTSSGSYSSGGHSSPEPLDRDNDDENARDAHQHMLQQRISSQKTKTSEKSLSGLPPTAAAAQEDTKTNGYSDENDSESGSDSNADSNDDDNRQEAIPRKSANENCITTATKNTPTTINNTSTGTTTDRNTSNTTNNEEDDDEAYSHSDSPEDDDSDNENENYEVVTSQMAAAKTPSKIETVQAYELRNGEEDAEADNGSDVVESDSTVESPTASSSSSEEEEEEYQPKRSTRQVKKPPAEIVRKPVAKKRRQQNWDSDESNESDDSEISRAPPPRRKPAGKNNNKQQQQRRKKKPYSSDGSEDDSKRFGTRRAAATVSYKEATEDEATDSEDLLEVEYDESQAAAEEEEDKSETIERVLARRIGKKGCTGNQTTIYAIEEHGDPNEGVDENDVENTEVQYLIKWKGWSYIHNTWESEDTLREQKAKGIKKLDNFIKKEYDIERWRSYASPEDIDYFECQQELQNDLLKSYNFVDRIIARNDKADGEAEYLCKWQSLPYAEATWEDASLVLRKWKRCVEQYEDRENSKCTPSRHCKVLKFRPKFYKIKTQPDFLCEGLILRDYQMDGLNWLLHSWSRENSVILADEMGLGKTIQTICFLYTLFKTHHLYGPFLCVVPLSTMTAWQREFDLWGPDMNVVIYLGDIKSREIIRQYEWQFDGSKRLKFNCILTTYEIVLKDKLFLGTLQWAALMVDEAHRLKNDDSLLYKSLKEFETNHRLLITGTPLQNSLKELWALLHFIMPEKFVNWEEFEVQHGNAADKGYTKLHQQLEPYILRRVKKDVEKSLPAKVEQILRVEMTSLQKHFYKLILTRNFDALRKGKKGSTSTFLNIVIELKKCCNHATLIMPPADDIHTMSQDDALQTILKGSGKLVLLDKLLCRLKETGHRVLIFSQMVRMLDVLADYLQRRHFSFQRLDGSIKGEMRRQALDHFNAEGSQDFCFLLSTRAGGLGINLATADTVIIFDSDWNPQNDLQAQARAHRIGQKNQVNIYRLVTARSVEEQIVERAKQKMVLDHLVIQRMDTTGRTVLDKSGSGSTNSTPFNKDDLSAILKFGAEELFKDEQENDDELVCDIDEILRRAETRNEDPEMPADDLLSAFKVASIVAFEEDDTIAKDNENGANATGNDEDDTKDWDVIIPENFRKKIEDEERAKEMEDLYLPPRRKTAMSNNDTNSKRSNAKKKAGDESAGDSDSDGGSDGSGDDGRPKKRGRPAMKEKIVGFTDAELRRFIKSYKKFPAPLERLESIACDAELQEKPLSELKRIGEMLHDRCVQFFEEHKNDNTPIPKSVNNGEESAKQRRSRATFSVKLGGVSFNAKTLLTCEEELKPLNEIIPRSEKERESWTLNIKTRPANFDVEWGVEEDSKILRGIYIHGIGSWEQMKMDPDLKLNEKILFNDARKPQAKHLQSRAEYLLKIIKKNVELTKGVQRRQRKPRKPRENKTGIAATLSCTPEIKARHVSESHGEDISQTADNEKPERKQRHRDSSSKADVEYDAFSNDVETDKRKKGKRSGSSKSGKTKKPNSLDTTNKPMHFTANNEPRALEVLGDLDPNIFNECKEKMRPVKKALKALDQPDSNLTNQEQVNHTRECLLSIGKQIDICLEAYKEPEKKLWRSNLWYFVSKFTEYDAKKLFKLYKHTLKTSAEVSSKNRSKSASVSPVKKSKDERTNQENGVTSNDKEKSVKKKKKGKEKDRDKEKGKDKIKDKEINKDKVRDRSRIGDKPKTERYGDSMDERKRLIMNTPIKRKYDDAESRTQNVSTDRLSYKRMNMDSNRNRNDERKKHHRDDYYGSGNSHDSHNNERIRSNTGGSGNDRRNSLNSPSTPNNRNNMHHNSSRLPPGGMGNSYMSSGDNRNSSPYMDGSNDRWVHSRDRFGSDFKRERYDAYSNRNSGGGYHRDRDNRDRRPDKRRYPPHPPPHNYYMPPNYFMANGVLPGGGLPPPLPGSYRNDPRYPPAADWTRDSRMDYPPDYRRGDYDRRPQT